MRPRYTKTILCLANSRKIAGRCVAGKEFVEGKMGPWFRPISAGPTGELSEEVRRYQNGQDPKLLDVVTIPMREPRPEGYQAENHLIDERFYWARERVASFDEVRSALDPSGGFLWDNAKSSYNGIHDRVEQVTANRFQYSLRLIEVDDLRITVAIEGSQYQKRKVRGHFTHNRVEYKLSVTDPYVERRFLAGVDGVFMVGRAILCVSLGEPFEGFAYKLIAGMIVEP